MIQGQESQLDQLLAERDNNSQTIINVDEPVIKLVIFKLAAQCFAFLGTGIIEVISGDEKVYFLPGMPASVEGVINVRGDIESVISLQSLLNLSSAFDNNALNSTAAAHSSILLGRGQLLKGKPMRSGLRVDQLIDVVDVPASDLQQPPDALPEHWRPFVLNLLVFNGLPVTVLDIDAVFATWLKEQD